MVGDVHRFCRSCLTCAVHRRTGRKLNPQLHPIPVGRLFERVGIDILEMPKTLRGNRYIVVFMEYLTKRVEAYAVEDRTSETIARLLIDNVVRRHGVPTQLLSDRGPSLACSAWPVIIPRPCSNTCAVKWGQCVIKWWPEVV